MPPLTKTESVFCVLSSVCFLRGRPSGPVERKHHGLRNTTTPEGNLAEEMAATSPHALSVSAGHQAGPEKGSRRECSNLLYLKKRNSI